MKEKKNIFGLIDWLKSRIFDKKCLKKYWNSDIWDEDIENDSELLKIMEDSLDEDEIEGMWD